MKVRLNIISFVVVLAAGFLLSETAIADWGVDFSRRSRATRDNDLQQAGSQSGRKPASIDGEDYEVRPAQGRGRGDEAETNEAESKGTLSSIYDGAKSMISAVFEVAGEPIQEIVILNTDRGFVPNTVRVRKGLHYKIHVVNVNEKEKNVSFILDGFSEHHATFYGKIKTFHLEPKKEGVFSFQSPETAAEGKLVVFNPQGTVRAPASGASK